AISSARRGNFRPKVFSLTKTTKPLQSKPLSGELPPYLYRTPKCASASSTNRPLGEKSVSASGSFSFSQLVSNSSNGFCVAALFGRLLKADALDGSCAARVTGACCWAERVGAVPQADNPAKTVMIKPVLTR